MLVLNIFSKMKKFYNLGQAKSYPPGQNEGWKTVSLKGMKLIIHYNVLA